MKATTAVTCGNCGAVWKTSIEDKRQRMNVLADSEECPFCRSRPMVLRNDVTVMFRDIFDNLNDISLKTEAVFFDHNGVSNPRMVIRLDDNYLIGCMLPKGFVLVQTRPNSPAPSPVELHHYLDINVGVQDAMVAAIKGAAEEVFEWLRAKMYLQPLKAKQDC